MIGRDVPQGETAPSAGRERVVLQSPRQQILFLRTHEVGRIEREQRLALLDALAHVVRIQALHPAADPRIDVDEVRLGILQDPDCPHRGSYRALGGPSKRDAEPRGFGTIERDPRRVGPNGGDSSHAWHPLHVRSGSLLTSRQRHGCDEQPDNDLFHGCVSPAVSCRSMTS